MAGTVLLVALALGQAPADQAVTAADKSKFLKLLAKLPTKGEFFTEEAVAKAVPYTRVLLALTKKDLEGRDLYPFLALSRALIDNKESRRHGLANFAKIAHPTIKLFWASLFFDEKTFSPEIVMFLRKALDSKEQRRILSEIAGPRFEELRRRVLRASEQ